MYRNDHTLFNNVKQYMLSRTKNPVNLQGHVEIEVVKNNIDLFCIHKRGLRVNRKSAYIPVCGMASSIRGFFIVKMTIGTDVHPGKNENPHNMEKSFTMWIFLNSIVWILSESIYRICITFPML